MGYIEEKNLTNLHHIYGRKIKLKSDTWRIFGKAPQKHFLSHVGGSLSSGSKGENRSFPGPVEQSVLDAFQGIGKTHHEAPDKFYGKTEVASWGNEEMERKKSVT